MKKSSGSKACPEKIVRPLTKGVTSSESVAYIKKVAASVLYKLFLHGNDLCHTTDHRMCTDVYNYVLYVLPTSTCISSYKKSKLELKVYFLKRIPHPLWILISKINK